MTPNPRKSGLMLMERLKVEDGCLFQLVALAVVVVVVVVAAAAAFVAEVVAPAHSGLGDGCLFHRAASLAAADIYNHR